MKGFLLPDLYPLVTEAPRLYIAMGREGGREGGRKGEEKVGGESLQRV